ncbi:MAG TPA: PEGA domain-containing protein, partial [Polyangia bacterium]
GRDDDDGDDDGHAGPRTAAIPRGKEVTFATRIAPLPPRPASMRARLLVGIAAVALVALSALAGARLRDASSPVPPPTVPKTARLSLHVLPADAALTLDGRPAHAGVVEVPAGTHSIVARAPGRQDATRTVTLTAGGADDVTLTLAPAELRLTVRSDPAGAEVLAGDRVLGTTPLELAVALEPGARLKIRKRDYTPVERALAVDNGAATVDVRLVPLPRGELTLGALPWAHVTIDGEKRPDTPLSKVALAAGAHQVRLVCPPTGKELRFTVQIEPGRETRKVADLRGEPKLVDE